MKPKVTLSKILFLLLLTSLLVACNTQTPVSPVPEDTIPTPTPEVFIPLEPSPTPSGSDLPLTCQVTDLKVFINQEAAYCFAYPQQFAMQDFPMLGGQAVQGPPVDNSPDRVAASFAVVVDLLDPNISLDQQVDQFLKGFTVVDPQTMTRARLTVGGESAVQVEMVPVQLSWRLVFVPHDGKLYRLMYWPVDLPEAQADMEELYQTTLNSFAFLAAENATLPNTTPVTAFQPKEGLSVTLTPLNLVIPPGLASGVSGSQLPPVGGATAAWFELTPGHTMLTLDGYLQQGTSQQPQIFVYPAQDFAELNAVASQSIERLQAILSNPGTQISSEQLPLVPFFSSVPVFASNPQVISFENGGGVRFLTQYAQSAPPVNNKELFYQFQGLTSDGAYYVVAILPVTAPELGENSETAAAIPVNGIAYPKIGEPGADWKSYYAAVTEMLNATPPKAFSPTLAQLDTLIQSIHITP